MFLSLGLCGTYDGDISNELQKPDLTLDLTVVIEERPDDFITSWRYVPDMA